MSLVRESLLSLIGTDRRRYHSAILTTFSFDPDFFDHRVMSHFRLCGIQNVNVLVDGPSYDEVIQQTAGRMLRTELSSRYSIYPVFGGALFHPKLWLLIGTNEALLIVGSGNLTMAGHLSNDEIWGAFHITAANADNQAIFAAAWTYVQQYITSTKGLFYTKTTGWITNNAAWLTDLPTVDPFAFSSQTKGKRIALLHNSPTQTIWQQLSQHLNSQDVTAITTVSPYYDQNGQALQALQATYPNATLHVVIEERGQVPATMPAASSVFFYAWAKAGARVNGATESGEKPVSRLHAKFIHWQTASGAEYCLFGSANVTAAGLGLTSRYSPNAEVSLLLESPRGGLLSLLGIVLKKENRCSLSSFRTIISQQNDHLAARRPERRVRLYSVEVDASTLTIYWEADAPFTYLLQLFNNNDRPIDTLAIAEDVFTYTLTAPMQEVNFVQVIDAINQQVVSNKLPVSVRDQLYRTNPNPILAEIESIYAAITEDGDLSRLLSLLWFAMTDKEGANSTSSLAESIATVRPIAEPMSQLPLNDLSTYIPVDQHMVGGLLQSPANRVLELLRQVYKPGFTPANGESNGAEEQASNLESGEDVEEFTPVHQQLPTKSALMAERKLLLNYLRDFTNHLNVILTDQVPVDLMTLTRYLIALKLILEYGSKVAVYTDKGQNGTLHYLPLDDGLTYDCKIVKGCCLVLMGRLLRLIQEATFKAYSLATTQHQLAQYKHEALVDTIVCILNVKWYPEEEPYSKTLLFNALHCLGWSAPDDYYQEIGGLITALDERQTTLKQRQSHYEANRQWFVNTICPLFLQATKKRAAKEFDSVARKGQIIYSHRTGYCFIKSTTDKPSQYIVAKAGFNWHEAQQAFCYEDPITIPKFTLVC